MFFKGIWKTEKVLNALCGPQIGPPRKAVTLIFRCCFKAVKVLLGWHEMVGGKGTRSILLLNNLEKKHGE